MLEHKTALFIIPDFRLRLTDSSLPLLSINTGRPKNEIEPQCGGVRNRLQASRAQQFKISRDRGADTNVLHEIPGSTVLLQPVRKTRHVQRATLQYIGSVLDHARFQRNIKGKWVRLEVGRSNTHSVCIIAGTATFVAGLQISVGNVLPFLVEHRTALSIRSP